MTNLGRWGVVFAVTVLALLGHVSAEAQSPMNPVPRAFGPNGQPARAVVAVGDVCAWPNLVMLPDGTIAAFIFNQPSHGRMIGGVDCWASTDGGTTWSKRATAVSPEVGVEQTRMNHAAGLANDGHLIVVVGGWTLYPKPNEHGPYEVDKLLRPVVARSADGGFTWKVNPEGFPAVAPDAQDYVPFGSIARASDGSLRVSAYVVGGKSFVLRSHDGGNTWSDPVQIETSLKPNETTLWSDGKGRMLAAARTRSLQIFESDDDGASWRHLAQASDEMGIPGDLRRLSDGRLLVTHGNRSKGQEGVDARVSSDGGRTWSEPRRLADFASYDGGYPSSVQRADGHVVTAFYARKTVERDAYQMGVVVWDPTRTFEGVPTAAPASAASPTPQTPQDVRQAVVGDGKRRVSYLVMPPTVAAPVGERWLVIFLYGAGGSLTKYNLARAPYDEIRAGLADRGAYVVVPDLGPSHFMNDNARESLTAVIEHAREELQIPPGRVHLMGTSMGAGSALGYAALEPDRVESVCAIMPMTDFAAWAGEAPKYAPGLAKAYGATVQENPEVYRARSARHRVDAFAEIPVFLVHGDADRTVPYSHSAGFADALRARGFTCTFRTIRAGAHSDSVVEGVQAEVVEFLDAGRR